MARITKLSLYLVVSAIFLSSYAQNGPIALDLQKHVNLFTGDFNYGIPLISVSGPNGETFPVGVNYNAGIRVDQEASWVGLGWSMNLGEISRGVNGFPDDWKGKTFVESTFNTGYAWDYSVNPPVWGQIGFEDKTTSAYGPVCFQDYPYNNTASKMDLMLSWKLKSKNGAPFEFPDYDNYAVSGPGIGGAMRPFLFDYASFHEPVNGIYSYGDVNDSELRKFSKEAQFRFINDGSIMRNTLPYYETSNYYMHLDDTDRANYPNYNWEGNLGAWDASVRSPHWVNANGKKFGGDFNDSTSITKWRERQRMSGANYIEYFTNQEIYDHYQGQSGDQIPGGFLDYKDFTSATNNRNSTSQYDPEGIGAFRITNPQGMVYHYSLPVYTHSEKVRTATFSTPPTIDQQGATTYTKSHKYAKTWKLTAITGLDYVDANGNNYVDEGDEGYWISIDYEKWNASSMEDRFPYYGYNLDTRYKNIPTSSYDTDDTYETSGSNVTRESDLYYPNYVKTSTQTLYFVKELRNDFHSIENANGDITPRMRLKRLVLLDNKDITEQNLFNSYGSISSTDFTNLNSTVNATAMCKESDYQSASSSINTYSLQSVEFDYSYALMPNTYNNIKNTPQTAANHLIDGSVYFQDYQSISGGHGKLTLTSINIMGYQATPIHNATRDSYQFFYPTSSALNPDFNHENKDFFGYHKKMRNPSLFNRTGYITSFSKDDVKAWSLEKIITPLGGEIKIDYESDEYSDVFKDGYPNPPKRYFNFQTLNNTSGLLVQFDDPDAVDFLTSSDVFLTRVRANYLCSENNYKAFSNNASGSGNGNQTQYTFTNLSPDSRCTNTNYTNQEGRILVELEKAYGGGLRVNQLSYREPDIAEEYVLDVNYGPGVIGEEVGRWRDDGLNSNLYPSQVQIDRFSSPQTVGYKTVRVVPKGLDNSTIGYTAYEFYAFPDKKSKLTKSGPRKIVAADGTHIWYRKEYQKLKSINVGLYGNPRKITYYKQGEIKTGEKTFQYEPNVDDMLDFTGNPTYGAVKEVFFKKTHVNHGGTVNSANVNLEQVFIYEMYFPKLVSVINKEDFKIVGGQTYGGDDKYGNSNDLWTRSGDNNHLTRSSRAFGLYTEMASKFTNHSNTNQVRESYKTKSDRYPETDAVSTWNDDYLVRELNTSGAYVNALKTNKHWSVSEVKSNNGALLPNNEPDENNWDKTFTSSLYDKNYNLIESIDLLGLYSAKKVFGNKQFTLAEAANSNYASFFHTSFEYTEAANGITYFDNEITGGHLQISAENPVVPHTGDKMAKITSSQQWGPGIKIKRIVENVNGQNVERGIIPGQSYEASVWMHKNCPDQSILVVHVIGEDGSANPISSWQGKDVTSPTNITIGDWVQVKLLFTIPEDFNTEGEGQHVSIFVWNNSANFEPKNVYIDDFRLQPINAQVSGTVYNDRRQLPTHVLDNENFYTRFEYDESGNVIRVFKETELGEKKISETINHFAN